VICVYVSECEVVVPTRERERERESSDVCTSGASLLSWIGSLVNAAKCQLFRFKLSCN
jgi:hypothetical protein